MRSREEKLEFKKELEARTLCFSVRVFKLLNVQGGLGDALLDPVSCGPLS